jgi:hypothetical protein
MRSNGNRRWIVDGYDDDELTVFRGSEQTIRWQWVFFNLEIVGVLGE